MQADCTSDQIEVRKCRFDHYDVRSFLDVESYLTHRFVAVPEIHLIRFSVAKLRRRLSRLAKRAIKRGRKLCRVSHDRSFGKSGIVQGFSDRRHAAIHHIARGDNIGTCLSVRYGFFCQ